MNVRDLKRKLENIREDKEIIITAGIFVDLGYYEIECCDISITENPKGEVIFRLNHPVVD